MKRFCLAMLTGLLLQAAAHSDNFDWESSIGSSPNGHYKLTSNEEGIYFSKDRNLIWSHPAESYTCAAVSDNGELTVCLANHKWALFDAHGQRLGEIVSAPLDLELDPPRTCWSHAGSHYLELSQGDIYVARQNSWQTVLDPTGMPAEVRRHRSARISDQALQNYLDDEWPREFPPNFRNLTAGQIGLLRNYLRRGHPRAAGPLGLARCRQARADLLEASDQDDAQLAIMLLDGPQAAAYELLPALRGSPSAQLLRLYEQVPCPEAVPYLVEGLREYGHSTHDALVAQTRVDLGRNPADWRDWLAHKDKGRLGEFQEPSAPLWKAQQDAPDLRQTLLKQPALVARFDLCAGRRQKIAISGNRLICLEGDAHNRTLEWSLSDGKPLVTMPTGVTDNADFRWNSRRQLLYYSSSLARGLWQSQHQVFLEKSRPAYVETVLPPSATIGKRPSWLPREIEPPEFSLDGDYVQRQIDDTVVRISLIDGTRQQLKARAPGPNSPDGRFWFGPRILMDVQRSLIYRTDLNLQAPCFSPDSQTLAGALYREIALLEAKNLRLIRKFPIPDENVWQLAFDDTGRRLAVVTDQAISVYDLKPEAPDLSGDTRLASECWTGYRLISGGARKLTEAEYWQRRRRQAQQSGPALNPYLTITAGMFGIGLLCMAYLVLNASARASSAPDPHRPADPAP